MDDPLDGVEAAPLVGQVERLEDVRERRVEAGHPLDGRLQIQETFVL